MIASATVKGLSRGAATAAAMFVLLGTGAALCARGPRKVFLWIIQE